MEQELTPHEAASRNCVLVDVRSASEYAAGHVPQAMHIPLEKIEQSVALLQGREQIVLVCKSGMRARMAQQRLAAQGVHAAVMQGGTEAWKQSGLPVEQSQASRWSLERQVRFGAGTLVLVSTLLAVFVAHAWLWLTGFVGVGLMFAGATDICGMGIVLAKMPWNRARKAA